MQESLTRQPGKSHWHGMPQGSGHSASDDLKLGEAGKPRIKEKDIKHKIKTSYWNVFVSTQKMSLVEGSTTRTRDHKTHNSLWKSSDGSYVISCHKASDLTTVKWAYLAKESPIQSIALTPRKPGISLKLNRGDVTTWIKDQLGERPCLLSMPGAMWFLKPEFLGEWTFPTLPDKICPLLYSTY